MIRTGLVSITFRELDPPAVVDLVARAGLDAIEWGGDVHVPHGDVARAREVKALTDNAGLAVSAYGSYYRCAHSEREGLAFASVVETAAALGAPAIRVWAGTEGSDTADATQWDAVVGDSNRIAEMAAAAGIPVAYEYHGGTLTDTNESAQRLLDAVDHPNIYTFWQPPNNRPAGENLAGLEAILPRVTNVHVFHWTWDAEGKRDVRPLAEGEPAWSQYLAALAAAEQDTVAELEHVAELEFVRGGDTEQFLEDARTLKTWVEAL